jgi:hypothetical protein
LQSLNSRAGNADKIPKLSCRAEDIFMGSGFTLLTCLSLLAAAQGTTGDLNYMNDREFRIPITLPDKPAERSNIARLFLYVSTDAGKSWRLEKTASPGDTEFVYLAAADGVYWFSVQTEDKQKNLKPLDISAEPPGLKVVVDTRKPVLALRAERQGDQVSISWDVKEDNPDLSTFKMEYRVGDSPSWQGIAVSLPGLSGQHRLLVTGAGPVSVRLQLADYAQNVGTALADAVEPAPQLTRTVSLEPGSPQGIGAPAVRAPAPDIRAPGVPSASNPAADDAKNRVIATTKSPGSPWMPAGNSPGVAQSAANPAGSVAAAPSKSRPVGAPLQQTNQRRIALNYEVKTGPSGVGAVQLWMTRDDGRTWLKTGESAEAKPPFPIELPPEDGLFGFILVVRSKAGLGRQDPKPGEPPDVRVELDTTPPEGEISKVEADPRRKDMLFLVWKAQDKNLAPSPITLKWAEKPGGDWKTIAENLANTGRYAWTMPEGLPYQVYLRLEIRDLAGNVGVAESEEPVVIDLQEPVIKLHGIVIEPQAPKP